MAATVQLGHTTTIQLKFTNSDGSEASPPTSGGSVSTGPSNLITASLGPDGKTVTIGTRPAAVAGNDVVNYNGPQGLITSEPVHVVATTATAVVFDETTIVVS